MIMVTRGVMTTTAQRIHGRPVREYLGIVTGDVVVAGQRRGHRHRHRTSNVSLLHAHRRALQVLARRASERGATVVLGVDIDCVDVGAGRLLVTASGTAVRL